MRVVAVGSGESGSGRSVIAANLGVALARRGARVVLVDLDLRSGDLHLRLGAPHAGPGVTSLLRH
ncbi:MAG: CpsD/CapB family tyrosine-protein kinase, partial [Acidobacteria bacterium]|nr:CpsD/CapB family tyrosine-protein kinase [Acidobacteriota bacterium]